ncbi:MAG: alanine racemase [Gudongella sp.]|nr:alanine racemase [Gudongella sp.]
MYITRPAYIEVDLDNLKYNYDRIREIVTETSEIMAIVKADAYGLGAENIVRELIGLGVNKFGVAHLSEAIHIRNKFKYAYILVMGYTPEYLVETAINNDIVLTVYLKEQAKYFSNKAKELNKKLSLHIKLETGMNRIGFRTNNQSLKEIEEIYYMDNLTIDGIFTHFPAADDNKEYTIKSMDKFIAFNKLLANRKIRIPLKHVNNSAAIMNFPEFSLSMVRAGIILYGIYPYPEANRDTLSVKPCLSLKAQVSHIKIIEPGEKLSYGIIYEAKRRTKVATVPLGYADGYSRELSNVGEVLVKGKRCPVIGRICMDQMMVDVTGLDVVRNDEVVLIGKQGEDEIPIEEVANNIMGIPASVLCMLTKRLPRVYIKDNKIKKVLDYLLEL